MMTVTVLGAGAGRCVIGVTHLLVGGPTVVI